MINSDTASHKTSAQLAHPIREAGIEIVSVLKSLAGSTSEPAPIVADSIGDVPVDAIVERIVVIVEFGTI
jgi:hypothetical protein